MGWRTWTKLSVYNKPPKPTNVNEMTTDENKKRIKLTIEMSSNDRAQSLLQSLNNNSK